MWVKVDDGFPQHPKVLAAAAKLGGPSIGVERVLGVWLQVMCYCNRHLTDGFMSDAAALDLRGTRPRDVLKVLALSSVRLIGRARGGWKVHDYHEYQPSKQEVQEKRQKERDRKRARRADSARNPEFVRADKSRSPEHVGAESVDPDPIRTGPTRPQEQDQDPRADARPVHSVLVKLAHDVLDALSDGDDTSDGELCDRIKTAAAARRVPYDGRSVQKALDAARGHRARRSA